MGPEKFHLVVFLIGDLKTIHFIFTKYQLLHFGLPGYYPLLKKLIIILTIYFHPLADRVEILTADSAFHL
jgi:hypothetical protein